LQIADRRIADCRLQIDGLQIADWSPQSTPDAPSIANRAIGNRPVDNPSIGNRPIDNPSIGNCPIDNPSICNLQSAICNVSFTFSPG
jgi:hypothetical protein